MTDPRSIAEKLIPQLEARHFGAEYVATGAEAKEAVLKRIPRGSPVMAGASTTLDQIGVTDALKGGEWEYLRARRCGPRAIPRSGRSFASAR